MHTAEIIIFVIVGILGSLFIILAVYGIRNNLKQENDYQKYVDSIKIGDTFGHDLFKFSNVDDPFCENHDTMGFDPDHCVTILDIKKNNMGETWVKYCFTSELNAPHCEWTDEINYFLECRTRISRRIDNINTNE